MKNLLTNTITLLVLILCLMYVSLIFGEKNKQEEIEKRALTLQKECYTQREIEMIIFNEIQE